MNDKCESGSPECGRVEFYDDDGVPLCRGCWTALPTESRTQRRMREAGLYVVGQPAQQGDGA